MAQKSVAPSLSEFSLETMGITANAAVGFGFMKTIIKSVADLAESNPSLARELAKAGEYWADGLQHEMGEFQDAIEDLWEREGMEQ